MDTRSLDQLVQELKQTKDAWAALPVARKVEYLQSAIDGQVAVAERQVAASNQAKGVAEGTPMSGEEWLHSYLVVRTLRLLKGTLEQIAATGRPRLRSSAVRTRPNGQVAARVFPLSVHDKLLFMGFRGEVWMRPDVTVENLADNMAGFYRQKEPRGKVALVLGAGNVASIGPLDMLYKLFAEGQVCLYKFNPVNDYLARFVEEAWGGLIRDGYIRTVHGGAEVGEYLCQHPDIDEIHLTGSDRTYEAIVFGAGEEGRQRKQSDQPRVSKRLTCELGNVTPTIVVPGGWSDSDLRFQAQNVATAMINNGGFNCISGRVLVMHKGWPRAGAFLDALREVLAQAPQRKAFYPGAEQRYDELLSALPTAQAVGPRSLGVIPYTLVPDLDPHDKDKLCFRTECFAPILAETSLPGADAGEFLRNAVAFCNETLWGTLGSQILVRRADERALGDQLEGAIADLRYGTIGINHWAALAFMVGSPPWGAYPGHAPTDIQSGIGTVHNTFLFDKPEKTIFRGPFRVWPKPPWFITNRRTHTIGPKLLRLETKPGLGKTMGIALTAIRG